MALFRSDIDTLRGCFVHNQAHRSIGHASIAIVLARLASECGAAWVIITILTTGPFSKLKSTMVLEAPFQVNGDTFKPYNATVESILSIWRSEATAERLAGLQNEFRISEFPRKHFKSDHDEAAS